MTTLNFLDSFFLFWAQIPLHSRISGFPNGQVATFSCVPPQSKRPGGPLNSRRQVNTNFCAKGDLNSRCYSLYVIFSHSHSKCELQMKIQIFTIMQDYNVSIRFKRNRNNTIFSFIINYTSKTIS